MTHSTRTTTTQNILWTEAEKKQLRAHNLEGLSIGQIAKAMGKSYKQVEGQRTRMKRMGLLPQSKATPTAADGASAIGFYREPTPFDPKAEQRMIECVNAQGGFPLYREIQFRSRTIGVLTTLDPHTPHPFQLAQLARAAA